MAGGPSAPVVDLRTSEGQQQGELRESRMYRRLVLAFEQRIDAIERKVSGVSLLEADEVDASAAVAFVEVSGPFGVHRWRGSLPSLLPASPAVR